ncbi:beta-ketoacyl synthase N-terminal-like domain-containing protein, partial [Desulfobacula sp.]|uniref:beta-ketoacyl synthase N-terminal-like domain-containing protein n=1 Tax=Desulfobacula sp. TaxID=2593537 RepID=UPI0025C31DFB
FRKTSTRHIIKNIDKKKTLKKVPCAIIGMETIAKECHSLSRFKDLVFGKARISPELPGSRWKKNQSQIFEEKQGFYLGHLSTRPGEFHIPPNQMDDILPQHILLLKAAKGALENARINPRPLEDELQRDHIGCAIGIEFDYGATDFHLRWKINHLDEEQKNAISPPLTFNRTLGALGGIVASRVAREFKLGGPCFTLSAGAASGIKAIETAVHSLSAHETDIFICGCVDLAGDIRQFALNDIAKPHTQVILPSEGACAIVLKRLDQAIEDGDRIYGVITGVAGASSGTIPGEKNQDSTMLEALYTRSLKNALKDSNTSLKDICLYETSLSGIKENDATETNVLNTLYSKEPGIPPCPVTSTSSVVGNTRGASALFSVIKTALCLNYRLMPLSNKTVQKACVASITLDGACSHVILEENGQENQTHQDTLNLDPALIAKGSLATSTAHEKFLEFSKENMRLLEKQFETLTKLAGNIMQATDEQPFPGTESLDNVPATKPAAPVKPPFLDRDQCLEYAIGKVGHVLGKEFEIIDTYPVRVRLPDEPLMLVDRIMDIQGEMLSLTSGKIITQHDVKGNAWYLDGGKAPVSISIEAGQADLFLCAWLGIDHVIKGTRKYRLLDARVTFHRTLPEPGETIEYHIEIDQFLKQGDVYLFFFHYKGYINDQLLISMRDGCAGFFTEQEVENSGGIILKTEALKQINPEFKFSPLVPVKKQSFPDEKIEALRQGDLGKAFGKKFEQISLGKYLRLPGGRMHLIDRVLEFDPIGGRFGLGSIIAEADIHPDDWFLTCHFIDDKVMPGTLMYECCAHALRIFTQRMGWVSDRDDVFYDVIPNNESDLKCRGPVTPDTKKARYEIEIKEMGYTPEPYVIADAHMFSDDLRIVLYKNMGMKLVGLTKSDLDFFWRKQ